MVNWVTPLWQYSAQGDIIAIQMLFSSGRASPVDVNAYGQSALHYAADTACIELCRFLVRCNADMYLRDENGRRPIDYAWDGILSNKIGDQASSELSTIFSDGEYLETRQFTSVHKTLLGLHSSSLEDQLALSNAQIDAADASGRTCLCWAAARGDAAAVRTLLDHGANQAIPDMEGCIPLFHAVRSHVRECVELLVRKTPDPSAVNAYGGTALHASYMGGVDDPGLVRVLLEQGRFDVNLIEFDGDTALNSAARAGLEGIARLLLDSGADPAIANAAGDTTLHMAVYWRSLGVLGALVEHGADFNFY
ncbi:hypothetical protein INS49_011901 [Diaporthe citri]|uniref:uncharacterized protein n=1 Tax=Diaporthe citri TaxID=83186 RepID=UPI001C805493|nr:uncharacterized protein INS49_011901 [Diaporthe citri]KAG6360834.1 hypothetical protein INS49_011901 [Diaporthe citri]